MRTVKIITTLNSNIINLTNIDKLLGKEVEITIKEIIKIIPKKKKKWRYSGSVDLKGKFDNVNIRDLAYE